MPVTDSELAITQYWLGKIKTDYATLGFNQAEDIFFGDQEKVPRTPSLCLEPGTKTRDIVPPSASTMNSLSVVFILYHSPVKENQQARIELLTFAEALEAYLHQDLQAGGLVTYGYVTSLEPGYVVRGNTLMHAARMTWEGQSKTRLQTGGP